MCKDRTNVAHRKEYGSTTVRRSGDVPGGGWSWAERVAQKVNSKPRRPRATRRALSPYQAHPTAVIDEGAEIGPGTRIWHFVHVSQNARIGARCSLGQGVFVGRGVRLGDGVKVQNNVSIYEGVEIEDDVFLGPSCVFTNVINPRAFIERKSEYKLTRVRRGATIGANATIVCGCEIGEYAFVGAGAVVTKSVAAFGLVVGNPAGRIGWMCRCGVRLVEGSTPVCGACGALYFIEGESCKLVEEPAGRGAEEGESKDGVEVPCGAK